MQIANVELIPTEGIIPLIEDGRLVLEYRWIGTGHGASIMQVETNLFEVWDLKMDYSLGAWDADTSSDCGRRLDGEAMVRWIHSRVDRWHSDGLLKARLAFDAEVEA